MELLSRMIRTARKERGLTQQSLGELVGVNKSQISKLENHTNSATIGTVMRVFRAMNADVQFNVRLENQPVQLI